jgi:cell division protein FtsB
MPVHAPPDAKTSRPSGPEPLRRKPVRPAPSKGIGRRTVHFFLVFATIVLVVDALVGEKGLMETLKARRHYREVAVSLDTLRGENTRLRDEVRRLKEDPTAIESVAREELGLMRPGELLFIIRDVKPAR